MAAAVQRRHPPSPSDARKPWVLQSGCCCAVAKGTRARAPHRTAPQDCALHWHAACHCVCTTLHPHTAATPPHKTTLPGAHLCNPLLRRRRFLCAGAHRIGQSVCVHAGGSGARPTAEGEISLGFSSLHKFSALFHPSALFTDAFWNSAQPARRASVGGFFSTLVLQSATPVRAHAQGGWVLPSTSRAVLVEQLHVVSAPSFPGEAGRGCNSGTAGSTGPGSCTRWMGSSLPPTLLVCRATPPLDLYHARRFSRRWFACASPLAPLQPPGDRQQHPPPECGLPPPECGPPPPGLLPPCLQACPSRTHVVLMARSDVRPVAVWKACGLFCVL